MALNELYHNISVFVYSVAPKDGTGVTLWLNYYDKWNIMSMRMDGQGKLELKNTN